MQPFSDPARSSRSNERPAVNLAEFQDLLEKWLELDRQAMEAERRIKAFGQLASSPEAAARIQEAFDKRRAADACLLLLLRSLKQAPRDPEKA